MEGIPGELVPAAEGVIQIVQMEGDAMEEDASGETLIHLPGKEGLAVLATRIVG